MLGLAAGVAGYRRRRDAASARIAGAAAVTVSTLVFLLASARYGLSLIAIGKLVELFS